MQSQRQYHENRFEVLKTLRQPWESLWQEVDQLIVPGYLRLEPTEDHFKKGARKQPNVIDNRAMKAHGIFRSGMQSGMTSKARPWNRLSTHDMELRDHPSVKSFLDVTTTRMREVMNKTNIYDTFHTKYGSLGAIGTAASYTSADDKYVMRNTHVLAGYYWIAVDHYNMVDTMYHIIPMTAQQIIGRFDKKSDNVPKQVNDAYDKGNRDQTFLVYHAMEPRTHRDTGKKDKKNMPYLSNYWMREDDDKDRMMRESGSKINRVIVSRWNTVDSDPYGYSLGMDALADVKQLQHAHLTKMKIRDKTADPPMNAPVAMRGKRTSLLPGAINYNDEAHKSGGLRPALELASYNEGGLRDDIMELHGRIDNTFYTDLFLAVSDMPGVQPRNEFEIAERKEEKLLQLGPALDRLQAEELQPTIGNLYSYMKEADLVPPLPPELEEQEGELTVEYTSIMAQAQKAVGVNSIERLAGYIGNFAAVKPEALDKFNVDQSINEYADKIGTPTSILVSDEEVEELRTGRAQEAKQEKGMAAAAQMAPAAKQGAEAAALLSQVDNTQGDPARLLDELGLAGNGAA